MKSILIAAAVLLGSSAIASAHPARAHEAPAYATSSSLGSWRFDLLQHRDLPQVDQNDGQTLTGGPSGGPNQS